MRPSDNFIVVINIATALLLWLFSLLFAGLHEYEYSAWVLIGIFLPGATFYFLKRSVLMTRIALLLNTGCLFYTGMEFLSVIARRETGAGGTAYLVVFPLIGLAFLFSSLEIWRSGS